MSSSPQLTISYAILFLLLVWIGYTSVYFWDDGGLNTMCPADDPDVVAVAEAVQQFYQAEGRFPDGDTAKRSPDDLIFDQDFHDRNDIDNLSSAGPDYFYVYFKKNCKLRVSPTSHDVYPYNYYR